MSTTLEAIAAREAGMEILGISLVTNLAAGMSGEAAQPRGGARGGPGRRLADGRAAEQDRAPDLRRVSEFPDAVESSWHEPFLTGDRIFGSDTLTVTVDPDLDDDRRLMLLETADSKTMVVLTPELADRMRLSQHADLTVEGLRQELRDAQIELDHWAVFGSFDGDRLVCAASMYPWGNARNLADLGVLTLPQCRGNGHAGKVVRAICRYAYAHGR